MFVGRSLTRQALALLAAWEGDIDLRRLAIALVVAGLPMGLILLLVLLLTVFWDLVTAVVVGVFLANILTIKRQADLQAQAIRRRRRRLELERLLLLAVRMAILALVVAGSNFLTYGTTERVAARLGARRLDAAAVD